MKRKHLFLLTIFLAVFIFCPGAQATKLIWGLSGGNLINLDPWTGTVKKAFPLPIERLGSGRGLAGSKNTLFYTDDRWIDLGDYATKTAITKIDPDTGAAIGKLYYSISPTASTGQRGLGYASSSSGDYFFISTALSEYGILQRISISEDKSESWKASAVLSIGGDDGGRIFVFMGFEADKPGIYEVNPLVNVGATYFADLPVDLRENGDIDGMAYDGTYLYMSGHNGPTDRKLFIMDNKGILVHTTDLGYTLGDLASTEGRPYAPIPGAVWLLGSGLIGIWMMRKR